MDMGSGQRAGAKRSQMIKLKTNSIIKERLCGECHPKRLRPGKVGSSFKSRKDWTGLPKPE